MNVVENMDIHISETESMCEEDVVNFLKTEFLKYAKDNNLYDGNIYLIQSRLDKIKYYINCIYFGNTTQFWLDISILNQLKKMIYSVSESISGTFSFNNMIVFYPTNEPI